MSETMSRRQALFMTAGTLGTAMLGAAAISGKASAATMGKEPADSTFDTEMVLKILVKLGETEDMGESADGHRINYPIIGGTFTGKGMKGTVIPGGADMSVRRNDGVTWVDALYRLRTDDGQVIIIHNAGIWRPNEDGLRKLQAGEKLEEKDYYCLTSPYFRTPPGKHAWMSQYIYVGTIDDVSENEVLIKCYTVRQKNAAL